MCRVATTTATRVDTPSLRALYGLERLGVLAGGAWQYPLADHLGSVRLWADPQGAVATVQSYAPFGEPLAPLDPSAPWGFTGEWHDPAGLVYLRARWYHVALGRFTQVDPFSGLLSMPASRHPYLYGLANPLRFSDPTGLFPDWQEAREILEDSLEFLLGAGLQYANDMTWGLYGEAYRRARGHTLADVPSPAFQRGRQLGRGLSTAVGTMHMAVGTTAAILALKAGPPTVGGALAAATPTGGISVGAGAILVTVEGLVVIVGAGQALYGGSVLAYAKGNPLEQSCGGYGDAPVPGRLKKLTSKEVRKYRLEPLKQEWGVPAKADLYKDPFTGEVYYQYEGGPFQHFTHVPEFKTR